MTRTVLKNKIIKKMIINDKKYLFREIFSEELLNNMTKITL